MIIFNCLRYIIAADFSPVPLSSGETKCTRPFFLGSALCPLSAVFTGSTTQIVISWPPKGSRGLQQDMIDIQPAVPALTNDWYYSILLNSGHVAIKRRLKFDFPPPHHIQREVYSARNEDQKIFNQK